VEKDFCIFVMFRESYRIATFEDSDQIVKHGTEIVRQQSINKALIGF
jgi:hypothetical protein